MKRTTAQDQIAPDRVVMPAKWRGLVVEQNILEVADFATIKNLNSLGHDGLRIVA
jgi:hypothetical protein